MKASPRTYFWRFRRLDVMEARCPPGSSNDAVANRQPLDGRTFGDPALARTAVQGRWREPHGDGQQHEVGDRVREVPDGVRLGRVMHGRRGTQNNPVARSEREDS